MGDSLSFRKRDGIPDERELIEFGKFAERERDRLLEERPDLKDFQKEIDRRLCHSGSPQNRLAVIGIMLEGKLRELQEQLSNLSAVEKRFHIKQK